MSEEKYDVIIIGSGLGSLACASILTRVFNKRVLMLEQYSKIGGFTHIFKRKSKYKWDVGLHYVGRMKKGSGSRCLFDYITDNQVEWNPMPDVFDRFIYPDFEFGARKGEDNFKSDLIARFPDERTAINRYFEDVVKAQKWYRRYVLSHIMPARLSLFTKLIRQKGADRFLCSTQEYLDRNFKDERLKAVLVSQWGDIGLPPAESVFVISALINAHYFEGGYYPLGGSDTIAASVKQIVEAAGGKIFTRHRVTGILTEQGRAVAVTAVNNGDNGEEVVFKANTIISGIGAGNTYNLLPAGAIKPELMKRIQTAPLSLANVTLYLGLKEDPASVGMDGANLWLYTDTDHNRTYQRRNELANGQVNSAYVSFPSKKDPKAEGHTAEIITFVDKDPFAQWQNHPWRNRGPEYENLKKVISNCLLDFVEERVPGLRDLVDYTELSTPLSTEYFTLHTGGAIYGMPATRERYHSEWISWRTPLKNLLMTGADTPAGHGIMGVLMGGIFAAGLAMGGMGKIQKIMKATACKGV